MKLSDTQSLILSKASQHDWRLAPLPKIPAAARNAVFRSMLKNGLLAECAAPREHIGLGWRQDAEGAWIALRITDAGLRAHGVDPNEGATVADTATTVAPAAETAVLDVPAVEAALDAPTAPDDATRTEDVALSMRPLQRRRARPASASATPPRRCLLPGTTRPTAKRT
jgi:hypothetical protein